MTPAERFFKARDACDAWLLAPVPLNVPERDGRAQAIGLHDEYVLARKAWDGYDAWRDARMELDR